VVVLILEGWFWLAPPFLAGSNPAGSNPRWPFLLGVKLAPCIAIEPWISSGVRMSARSDRRDCSLPQGMLLSLYLASCTAYHPAMTYHIELPPACPTYQLASPACLQYYEESRKALGAPTQGPADAAGAAGAADAPGADAPQHTTPGAAPRPGPQAAAHPPGSAQQQSLPASALRGGGGEQPPPGSEPAAKMQRVS
jgi:hypothetical protein